jgi:chromosome partitioning protein
VEVSTAEVMSRTSAATAVIPTDWSPLVDLLPASPRLQARESSGSTTRLRTELHGLVDRYEAILVDCPPSLGNLTAAALTAADHAVIVVEPSALGLRGIGAVADVIDDVWDTDNADLQLAGVILNRVPAVSTEADRRIDELGRLVGRKAIWQPPIPQRVIVNQAIGERCPIHGYGARSADVAAAFDQLWGRLRRVVRR